MSNGDKHIVFNTRERVISNDHNRLQDMIAQTRAATLARLHNDQYDVQTPGYAPQQITGGQTPMIADVFGGLFVTVDDPNSLFVDPGVVGVVHPDVSPGLDDDPYNVINDPGLNVGGFLPWQINGSGNIRIDVIIADIGTEILETDNRDIFDPSTGLFTPMTVNKVIAKRLAYSIIRGTPGAGMPALPNTIVLAVASVPDASASWADVTFWDVRPLVQSRIKHFKRANVKRLHYEFDFVVNTSIHTGYAYSEFGGYLAGGRLMTGVPSGDTEFDDTDGVNATNNATYTVADEGANPIFLLFPSGLPRWARYSVGSAPGLTIRAPYGTNGLLVIGRQANNDHNSYDEFGIATGIALPVSTGLIGTSPGVLLYMKHVSIAAATPQPVDVHGVDRTIFLPQQANNAGVFQSVQDGEQASWAVGDTELFHNLTDIWDNGTVGLPRNMRSVRLRWDAPPLQLDAGTAAPDTAYQQIGLYVIQENTFYGSESSYYNLGDGTGTIVAFSEGRDLDIPVDFGTTPVRLQCGITVIGAGNPVIHGAPSAYQFQSGGVSSDIRFSSYDM